MNSISKRQKFSQEENSRQFEDRITNLPSSLVTKILSCLPTKDAVKTSILSREWKRAWTFVYNLDFDDTDCKHTRPEEEFVHFVNRVFLLRERSSLQRFHLRCECHTESRVNTWIASVLLCHVQELDLSVRVRYPTSLISDIFTCKTLVVLKLEVNGEVNLPTSVDLPHLKTLHLAYLEFDDNESIRNLLSGCPVLEELYLSWCLRKGVYVVDIIGSELTTLTLEYLPYDDTGSEEDQDHLYEIDLRYEIVLDTPALKFLNLDDYVANGYVVKILNHLEKATINVGVEFDRDRYDNYRESIEIRSGAITDLLNGISQVQSLVLTDASMRAIHVCDIALPIFNNLTSLELRTTCYIGWHHLLKLLKNSPCLETLYIRKKEMGREWVNEDYMSTDEVPCCFLSHLKVIEIDKFEGFRYLMEMVEYFLGNGKVLEKLTINLRPGTHLSAGENTAEKDNFYKKLLMLRKASSNCKVEVL